MNLPLAITRGDVADYVYTFVIVYFVLIFITIVLSWFPRIPYNPVLNSVIQFVTEVTNPYLRIFRRFIPSVRAGPMALDLSPMVAIFVLLIVGGLVASLIRGG